MAFQIPFKSAPPLLCFLLVFTWNQAEANAAAHSSPLLRDPQGRPATMVSVNGSEPIKFVVDTAAQTMAVGKDLIEMLDLQPHPEETAQLHGSTGVIEVPLYPIASLEVGGSRFEDLLAPSLPHDNDSDALGILGMSVMGGKRLTFDQAGKVMRIEKSGGGHSGMRSLPVNFIYGTFARIKVRIGGVDVIAVVDTGARKSVANRSLMEALGLSEDTPGLDVEVSKGGVTGHEARRVMGYEGVVAVGSAGSANQGAYLPIKLEFTDLPVFGTLQMAGAPALILGNDALGQLKRFAIDFGEAEFLYKN